jgi:ethanolamine transporter EutH
MELFSFTRFCLRVLADLNEIIRRMKRNVILTIAIIFKIKFKPNKSVHTFAFAGLHLLIISKLAALNCINSG